MNWLIKVAAFKLLSAIPAGSKFYRFGQETFTKSLAPTAARVDQKIGIGSRYFQWLEQNGCTQQLIGGTHLDLGTGWHATIPLLYYSLGVDRQLLFDIVPVLRGELVAQTIEEMRSALRAPSFPLRDKIRRLPEMGPNTLKSLADLKKFGIEYFAPYQQKLEELNGAIDLITSTQVLLHIDRTILRHIFRDLYRALKPGGKFLAMIHLTDLYANSDPAINRYNHLKYSPKFWNRWINSPLMSYNRLKASDYHELLTEAGFVIRHFEVDPPTPEHLKELDSIKIDPAFSKYSRNELGATHLFFVAERV